VRPLRVGPIEVTTTDTVQVEAQAAGRGAKVANQCIVMPLPILEIRAGLNVDGCMILAFLCINPSPEMAVLKRGPETLVGWHVVVKQFFAVAVVAGPQFEPVLHGELTVGARVAGFEGLKHRQDHSILFIGAALTHVDGVIATGHRSTQVRRLGAGADGHRAIGWQRGIAKVCIGDQRNDQRRD